MLSAVHAWIGRHRIPVLIAWAVLIVAAIPAALGQADHLTGGGFQVPGAASERVEKEVQSDVPIDYRPTELAPCSSRPRARRWRLPRGARRAGQGGARDATGRPRAPARRNRALPRSHATRPAGRRPAQAQRRRVPRAGRRQGAAQEARAQRGPPVRGGEAAPRRCRRAVGGDGRPDQGRPQGRRARRLPGRRVDPAGDLRVLGRGRAAAGDRRRLGVADDGADRRCSRAIRR